MHHRRKHTLRKIAAGTTVGALLAAGAAAYFFTQTKAGRQAAKKVKEQAVHVSREIADRVSKARQVSQKKYNEIVDEIVEEYGKKKKIAKTEAEALKKDLKSHWKDVRKELKSGPARKRKSGKR